MFFTSSKDNLSLKARNFPRSASVKVNFSELCLKEAHVFGSKETKGADILLLVQFIQRP